MSHVPATKPLEVNMNTFNHIQYRCRYFILKIFKLKMNKVASFHEMHVLKSNLLVEPQVALIELHWKVPVWWLSGSCSLAQSAVTDAVSLR